jgi:TM2 domain-containing membrane protein YozV
MKLSESYYRTGNYFLSYLNAMNAFMLAEEGKVKYETGRTALRACLAAGKYSEAGEVIAELGSWFPDSLDRLLYLRAYTYTLSTEHLKSSISIAGIPAESRSYQAGLLQAFNHFNLNNYTKATGILESLQPPAGYESYTAGLVERIAETDNYRRKSKTLSTALSAILPGAGQLYAGYPFDAMNTLVINGVAGLACLASWSYTLERPAEERGYLLASASTALFTFTYLANLYNAINLTNRANMFSKNERIREAISGFDVVINDRQFMLGTTISF